MNQFEQLFTELGRLDGGLQLYDFLEKNEFTLYGVSLQPSKILKLRREMQKRYNVNPEDLQR